MRLEGKVAIVTGGARGIGEGIARCLAAEGARLALIDIDGPEAEAAAGGFHCQHRFGGWPHAYVFISAYAAAKAGVISLTRSLALELAHHNIRVNVICPGLLWTRVWEMLALILKESVKEYTELEPRDIFLDRVKRGVPLGREQTPEDIGKLVAFLCSSDAQNITGQTISVDGGITLRGA